MQTVRGQSVQAVTDEVLGVHTDALLASIVESSDDAIISKTLDGLVTSWNRGAEALFGYSAAEMLGSPISKIVPESRVEEERDILERIRNGERIAHFSTVRRDKSGKLIEISLSVSPIIGPSGDVVGASNISRDISAQLRAARVRKSLEREVNHRTKNLLAVVEAIVRQTAKTADPADVTHRISQRLQSLAANQDLLSEGDWQGTGMRRLVDAHIGHLPLELTERVNQYGDDLMLSPSAGQAVGMALHELFTNAVKFGALSGDAGEVSIHWSVDREDDARSSFTLSWREAGGPEVSEPVKTGFGYAILKQLTSQSVGGVVSQSFAPEGFSWTLTAPADDVLVADQMAQRIPQ